MVQISLEKPGDLKDWVGKELGTSKTVILTQEKINMFAESTGDDQWIHVDVERANKESPFGGPIAHGYLTLSVIPDLFFDILEIKNAKMVVNYGLNKVRFPAPVPAGSEVNATVTLKDITDIGEGNLQVEFSIAVQVVGAKKPSCVAAVVFRYYV